jgi:hypothetical protein
VRIERGGRGKERESRDLVLGKGLDPQVSLDLLHLRHSDAARPVRVHHLDEGPKYERDREERAHTQGAHTHDNMTLTDLSVPATWSRMRCKARFDGKIFRWMRLILNTIICIL